MKSSPAMTRSTAARSADSSPRPDPRGRSVARAGHAAGPHRIVAELSFGFWISLLGSGGRSVDPAGRKANLAGQRPGSARQVKLAGKCFPGSQTECDQVG